MTNKNFKSSFHEKLKMLAVLVVLITSVSQVYAAPWVKLDVSTGSQGTKTVGDKLNGGSEWWYNYQTNGNWSSATDIQVLIGTSSSSYSTVNASWYADDGSNKKVHADIGSFTFDKSGIWYAVGKYKSGSTAYTSGTSWTSNTSLSSSMSTSNSPYWTVNPPSVKNFSVSTAGSNIISGDGTSANPYLITPNGSLVLSLSGEKNKTDANSSLQYNTAGTWNSTTSRTISSITNTDATSVTVKMRCYNSTASLSGTESTKTIYYKAKAQGFESSNNGIKYYNGSTVEWKFNGQSAQTRDLSSVTTLYLKEWFTYEYENWDGCKGNTKFQYNIHRTAVGIGDYTDIANNWNIWDEWTNGWRHPKFGHNNQNVNLLDGLGSGKYTMSFRYNDSDLGIISDVHSLNWQIDVPAMATHTVTSDGTGDGSSGTPFSVAVGGDLTITVSGTKASSDANSELYVSFDGGTSYSTTNTYTINSITSSKLSLSIKAKYRNDDDNIDGTVHDFGNVYYQGTLTPSLAISSFTQNASAVTAANAGTSVTINASRQNAGTASITYAYSTDNSNWTTIASTQNTSQSWTLPAVTATTTYYVKVSMTYDSNPYSDTQTFTVYGKKTIKVKDTNGWGDNFKIHRWGGVVPGTEWPGETTNITSLGGQWKQVVLYSSSTDFLFDKSSDPDHNKTANKTYAGMTNGDCYEIASGTGGSLALTRTDNCPAAPTVTTTAAPASITNIQMTIKGNISSNGNDNITDYGFYWGTTNACGTKEQVGTSDYTGAISKQLTDLTAGTTYYFKAYATNGQGTTYGTVRSYKIPYSVTITKSTGCSSITPTAGSYYYNAGFTVTAVAATGYNFSAWTKTNGNLSGATSPSAGTNTVTFTPTANDATITATYTAKTYTVSIDQQSDAEGHGADGTVTCPNATYNATAPTLSGTVPTAANGYCFMGFYTEPLGAGVKLVNVDKSWVASVAGYTDENKKWIRDGGVTLYAYYKKAEVTEITVSPVAPEPGATVNVTATISPEPVAPTIVCWEVQHENGNPLSPQPTFTPASASGTSVSFVAPATSATYKVQAKLSTGSTCGAGTQLDTETANFTVAGSYSVTVNYKSGGNVIKASTSVSANASEWTEEFSAPDIFGYTFTQWDAVDGVTIKNGESDPVTTTTNQTIQIKAVYDGSLTASYSQKSVIYFKNTLGWSDVYVNFYTGAKWNNPKGSGNSGVTNRNKHMTHLDGTDIWYYDYGADNITPSLYVSFTDDSQDGYDYFWKASPGINVVYPANYPDAINTDKSAENGFKAATPMFVPLAGQDAKVLNSGSGGMANYYNAGYWTKYTAGTGYTLEIYNTAGNVLQKSVEFTSVDELMPMQAVVDLEANYTYKYQLRRGGESIAGIYYGNTGTMTYTDHGQDVPWDMNNSMYPFKMVGLTTTAAGDYTFNLCYAGHAVENPHYRLRMEVDYPIANGDYRVIYCDNVHTLWHPSAIVSKGNNRKDTVSFFIRPGSTPYMNIQQASVADNGAITWSTYSNVSSLLTSLPKDSVYNVCLTMNNSGAISVEAIVPYSGNYYIRTDCANSKWDNYRSDPDHLMTYSEYSITHGGYSHYYTHWVNKDDVGRKNVKFCIANDYSPCISDTLARETATGEWANIGNYIEAGGDLKRNANVRFMWNRSTNAISRAYIDGAQGDDNKFLVLLSADHKIKNSAGSAELTEVRFSDNQNWIYEANIKAQVGAQIKLKSTWGQTNVIEQYFKGSASTTEQLIGGNGDGWYDIRLIYDFKTNRLVAGWVPASGTYTEDNPINADIMFLREHQGDIAQIIFSGDGKISKIETAYGVMRFNKWTLNNKDKSTHSPLAKQLSIYERSLFFISFPFRVKLSEVFGFGTYMKHWAIQKYDGADRAARGNFQENGGFWKWMNRTTEYLEPNQGYLLAIDLELLKETSDIWTYGVENVELFFPSYGKMPDISKASVTQTLPEHTCDIDWYRDGKVPGEDTGDPRTSYKRTIYDSHWNVMSVPTYVNTSSVAFNNVTWTTDIGPKFLYTWNSDDNTITATTASGYTYQAMHAYMVQYCGQVVWTANSGSPSSIIARSTYMDKPKEVEFNLELLQNDKMLDRTYVVMSEDEEVSAGFKFGEDMTKEFNANKSHIYTFIPGVAMVGGNTLPLSDQTTVVPVGVDVKADGEYILSVPEGTSGVGVTLVDKEKDLRANLALSDYAVTLPAGTYNERFVLEISPIEQIVTNVELINGENGDAALNGVSKKLIDGVLYIIKDGKVFDARGARIQ